MLAGEGLHPSSKGARVRFDAAASAPSSTARSPRPRSWSPASGSSRSKSRDEAIEWVKPRARSGDGEIEIRQVFEAEDFGDEFTPELREQEERLPQRDRRAAAAASRPRPVATSVDDGSSARDRRGLADRVRPADRRPRAHDARRRPRRGPGPGRAGRGAGAVAARPASRTTRAPGSWPPPSTAPSTCSAATQTLAAQARGDRPRRSRCAGRRPRRPRRGARRRRSATTCCGLVFTACHPVLSTEARVALTLRLLGGLTTEEIARAFLVPEPTIAQRIVARQADPRRGAACRSRCPRGDELAERLASVLEVDLPDLQRGLLGHRRRRLDAPGALRGRAAARPHPGRARARASPRCTAWSR